MHNFSLLGAMRCLVAFGLLLGGSVLAAEAPPQYARDVQPLLKRHCVKCHGPARREGGLNLSTPGGIVRGGKNGAALVPHDVKASLIWKRVSEDEMPPDEPLAEIEKELLRKWIEAGTPGLARGTASGAAGAEAEGKEHWAFQKLKAVPVPAPRDVARVANDVDRFLQAALEEERLSLGPEADRATLIRRVSFDLIGLPPAPDEIAAFLADDAPGAYVRMVERYLGSPHYGERWAKYWLDSAGYADSNGYFNADSDRPLAWRYRDWVVRALNRDEPFDRFVREQLAGDELAGFAPGTDATPTAIELLEATHYLRNGQDGSGESDGNPDEVRADRYYAIESVVQNVTNSLFGLTIQCAKCHDHKFEPISQRDYYSLQAVFAPAFNLAQWVKPNERFVYASLPGEFANWEARARSLDAELGRARTNLSEWVRQSRPRGQTLLADTFEPEAGKLAERWSSAAPGDNSPGGAVSVRLDSSEAPGLAIRDGRLCIVEGNTQGDSWVSTREKFAWAPEEPGAAIQVTFDLVADRLDESGKPAERIGYFLALHDFNDDSPTAGGNILIDGHPAAATAVHLDYPGADSKSIGEIGGTGYKPGHNYGVRVTRVEDDKYRLEHLVDFLPDGKSLTLAKADLPEGGFGFEYCCGRSFVVDNLLIERFPATGDLAAANERFRKELAAQRQPLEALQKQRAAMGERPGKIAWVSDVSETAPDWFLLERGDYGKPAIKVEPAGLSVLSEDSNRYQPAPPTSALKTTGRRLALANWATAPGSSPAALLARVQVNRVWQKHFGTGIVSTPDNLGLTGAAPSHPELLDWLAGEFVRSGWSLKSLHRLIVNSAAYRQTGRVGRAVRGPPAGNAVGLTAFDPPYSSDPTEDDQARRRDPDNRLLWHFPVRRLDAEAVRDALLAVSGDLDPKIGGPAVAIKRSEAGEVVAADPSGGGRRRSIYLQQKRTQVVSFLNVFDAPSIVFNSVQRPVSTMPLQALALLNSDFALERARNLAARLEKSAPDEAARLRLAYVTAWGREPELAEVEKARAFLDAQQSEYEGAADARQKAWADLCQMLLASNEFLYIE